MTILPETGTDSGRVRGLWRLRRGADGSVSRHAIFLGVPFAAPPVGEARFDAPRAVTAWSGVRDCFLYGATSQLRSPWDPPRIPEPSIAGPEVLNVNVTTPDPTRGAKLPLLVWIERWSCTELMRAARSAPATRARRACGTRPVIEVSVVTSGVCRHQGFP